MNFASQVIKCSKCKSRKAAIAIFKHISENSVAFLYCLKNQELSQYKQHYKCCYQKTVVMRNDKLYQLW